MSPDGNPEGGDLSLVIRRTIHAPAEKLFDAWVEPAQLRNWWGPEEVTCGSAEVDLRVGGAYRIANEFADGRTVWISGEFKRITPPTELVYTWIVEDVTASPERVTVRFDAVGGATEVTIIHDRIIDNQIRSSHESGWQGCLAGLAAYLETPLTQRSPLPGS